MRFLRKYREGIYQRERGRLRSWLLTIARNCVIDLHRERARRREHRGASALEEVPDEADLEAGWDEECERTIVQRALDELRGHSGFDERTLIAFERVAFGRVAPAEVAASLGITVDSVYAAKSRCVRRLRKIVSELEVVYEVTPP